MICLLFDGICPFRVQIVSFLGVKNKKSLDNRMTIKALSGMDGKATLKG